MEPELWDGNFHPISLHGFMKHLALDSKNIKNSLNFMAKYISNKQINFSKLNDIEDFHGISEAIWNFISSIYQANWDLLNADKYANTLRWKISAKFTPKVLSIPNKSNKATNKLTLLSIEKISPSIPTKLQNEVNQISKYFKNIKLANVSKQSQKSYAQALKQGASTFKVIKIKEAFLSLDTKKKTRSTTSSRALLRQNHVFK